MAPNFRFTVTLDGELIGTRKTENRHYTHAVIGSKKKDSRMYVIRWSSRLDLAQGHLATDAVYHFNVSAVEVDQKTQEEARIIRKKRGPGKAAGLDKLTKAQRGALAWVDATGEEPGRCTGNTLVTVEANTTARRSESGYRESYHLTDEARRAVADHPFAVAGELLNIEGFRPSHGTYTVNQGLTMSDQLRGPGAHLLPAPRAFIHISQEGVCRIWREDRARWADCNYDYHGKTIEVNDVPVADALAAIKSLMTLPAEVLVPAAQAEAAEAAEA